MSRRTSLEKAPIEKEEYAFGDNWNFVVTRSHIRKSTCSCRSTTTTKIDDANSDGAAAGDQTTCHWCRYERELPHLTQLPDMIFADNVLTVRHLQESGGGGGAEIRFDPLGALKTVESGRDPAVKVNASEQWLEARKDCPFVRNTIEKPYDWTFTPTNYGGDAGGFQKIEPTDERIDLERLKIREPILFYQELPLYEDELADNGASQLTLKFRCMPSGWFALLRFYLRVDFVHVSILDCRFHWRADRPTYVLREWQTRRKPWAQLDERTERANVLHPDLLWPTLPAVQEESRAEKMMMIITP